MQTTIKSMLETIPISLFLGHILFSFPIKSYTKLSWYVGCSQRFSKIQASICINVEVDQGIATYGVIPYKGV